MHTEYGVEFHLHNVDTGEWRSYELVLPVAGGQAEACAVAHAVAKAAGDGAGSPWQATAPAARATA